MKTTLLLTALLAFSVALLLVPPAGASETVSVCTEVQHDCGLNLVCVSASGTVTAFRCVRDPCENPEVC
ncbi:MAG: hypothetical protein QOE90_3594 [Thermoplasmata archaeon]|jgi:hypothetical protein|nr:hypothetical protein [Thermoplasmata archaeon]